MDQTFSLRRFFPVVLAIFVLTTVMSGEATRSDFSGHWVRPRPDASGGQYLDLRADGTYHLRSEYNVRGVAFHSTSHSGTWTIVNGKRKLIELSGGLADNPQTPDDRVNGSREDLNLWTRK
jgi:hypothetical protein